MLDHLEANGDQTGELPLLDCRITHTHVTEKLITVDREYKDPPKVPEPAKFEDDDFYLF